MVGEGLEVSKYHQVVLMGSFSKLAKIVMNGEGVKAQMQITMEGWEVTQGLNAPQTWLSFGAPKNNKKNQG